MSNLPKVGLFISMSPEKEKIEAKFKMLQDFDIHSCQILTWHTTERTPETAKMMLELCDKYEVQISNIWSGWTPGPWGDYYDSFFAWGIVPTKYRYHRIAEICQAADWAKMLGVKDVTTHCGYIPENPHNPLYKGFITGLKKLLVTIRKNDQFFNFETGQETPMTILRTIEDCGTENLGVNLDTANLILYGKGHPVYALDMFGKYVRGLHCKDGFYPTDGKHLGREVPLGEGLANIPEVVRRLHELGYKGAFTIEREISDSPEKARDIINARDLLRTEISKYEW